MATQTISKKLADLLATKNLDVKFTNAQGQNRSPVDADVMSFDWSGPSGQNYGTVVIVIDDTDLLMFFGDNLGRSMDDPQDKTAWLGSEDQQGFVQQIKNFATRNNIGTFTLMDINQLKHHMAGMAAIKEGLFEGYYGNRKVSYMGEATAARLVIKHNRTLGETDKRYRYVESLFIETADGERFKLPFVKLAGGRAMLEHVRQGGRPYDIRGCHIAEMVTEMNVLSRFRRASQGRVFEGSTANLVESANNYYEQIKNNLAVMSSSRGYQQYFESWTPADINSETQLVENIKEMFVQQTLDNRIESALPILAKIQQQGTAMKEVEIFETWANRLVEGTWALPDTPEAQAKLDKLMGQELIVGPDATNAKESLYDVIGDDQLYDILNDLARQDPRANIWDDSDVQARLAELGIQTPQSTQAEPADVAQDTAPPQQGMAEDRLDELSPDTLKSYLQKSKGRSGEFQKQGDSTDNEKKADKFYDKRDSVTTARKGARDRLKGVFHPKQAPYGMKDVAEGSGPKEKQKTPYRDINSAEYRAAAEKQKQQMAKDKLAEPGKKLLAKKGVAEGLDQPKEAGKAIQSLQNLALMKSALTMTQLMQAGRESIVTNALAAAAQLEQNYKKNNQLGNAIFVRALRDEIDNFKKGYPINASFPESDNASELGDLLQGKLGKVNFQQGVAEGDDNFGKPAAMMRPSAAAAKTAQSIVQKQADKNVIGMAKIAGTVPAQGVAEGSADKTVKVVKRRGKPIGEIGIDPEASPGNGSYYVKLYDGSVDLSGFDTAEEALAELKYLVKQSVAEAQLDEINWKKAAATGALALGALGGLGASGSAQARVTPGADGQMSPSAAQQMAQQGFQASAEKSGGQMPNQNLDSAEKVERGDNGIVVHYGGKEYKGMLVPKDSPTPRGAKLIKIQQTQMGERGIGNYSTYLLPNGTAYIYKLASQHANEGVAEGSFGQNVMQYPRGSVVADKHGNRYTVLGHQGRTLVVKGVVDGKRVMLFPHQLQQGVAEGSDDGYDDGIPKSLSDPPSITPGMKVFSRGMKEPHGTVVKVVDGNTVVVRTTIGDTLMDIREIHRAVAEGTEFGAYYYEQLAQKVFDAEPNLQDENAILKAGYDIAKKEMGARANDIFRDDDFASDFVSAYGYLKKNHLDEGSCNQTMEGEYCPEHGLAECGYMESVDDPINYNAAVTGSYYESDELARIKKLALLK